MQTPNLVGHLEARKIPKIPKFPSVGPDIRHAGPDPSKLVDYWAGFVKPRFIPKLWKRSQKRGDHDLAYMDPRRDIDVTPKRG